MYNIYTYTSLQFTSYSNGYVLNFTPSNNGGIRVIVEIKESRDLTDYH